MDRVGLWVACSSVFLALLHHPRDTRHCTAPAGAVAWLLVLALRPHVGAGLSFNAGLRYVQVSSASVVRDLGTCHRPHRWLLHFCMSGSPLAQLIGGGIDPGCCNFPSLAPLIFIDTGRLLQGGLSLHLPSVNFKYRC